MAGKRTGRTAFLVHKWTSLPPMVFLLFLCLSGLPLVFHDEIDAWFELAPPQVAATGQASIDGIVARALAAHPGDQPISLGFLAGRPLVLLETSKPGAGGTRRQAYDLHTGAETSLPAPASKGVTDLIKDLHTSLLAGLPGTLLLGVMGLLLAASVVSGVVVYAPYMRKLA